MAGVRGAGGINIDLLQQIESGVQEWECYTNNTAAPNPLWEAMHSLLDITLERSTFSSVDDIVLQALVSPSPGSCNKCLRQHLAFSEYIYIQYKVKVKWIVRP